MTKRIQRVAPLQLGIVLASVYGAISLIFVPFILLFAILGKGSQSNTGGMSGSVVLVVLIPFLYAAFGFIGGIIAAAVYNFLAKWTGGIEITFADVPELVSLERR